MMIISLCTESRTFTTTLPTPNTVEIHYRISPSISPYFQQIESIVIAPRIKSLKMYFGGCERKHMESKNNKSLIDGTICTNTISLTKKLSTPFYSHKKEIKGRAAQNNKLLIRIDQFFSSFVNQKNEIKKNKSVINRRSSSVQLWLSFYIKYI